MLDLGTVLLYVRDSTLGEGWWGITKSVDKSLLESRRDWQVLLLSGDGEEGYLFPKGMIVRGSTENEISYILHEHQDTGAAIRFHSFDEVFSLLGL